MDSNVLNEALPIVPHNLIGVDCCGCIFVRVEGADALLVCNECGTQVGRVNAEILVGLLQIDAAKVTCPYCDKVSTFPGAAYIFAFVCQHCGQGVEIRAPAVN